MNQYRIYITLLGIEGRLERVVSALSERLALNDVTRGQFIEITPGTYCPVANLIKIEVEAIDKESP